MDILKAITRKEIYIKLLNLEHVIHGIKTTIACLIGVWCADFVGFPGGLWIVITIIVVMCAQIYVGSVIQKSLLRFLGTVIGCFIAAMTIIIFGTTDTTTSITIAISSFLFSYFATSNENLTYAGTLGAATTVIILLTPHPTIDIALTRFLEISLGLFIAAMISQFVMPVHARTHLRGTQAKTLGLLRQYYEACIIKPRASVEDIPFEDFDENIVKLLSKQRQLAKEAKREPLGMAFDPKIFVKSLECEKEILRAIDFMHHALLRIQGMKSHVTVSQAMLDFNSAIVHIFDTLVAVIVDPDPDLSQIKLAIPEVANLKQEVQLNVTVTEDEDYIYVDGYLFGVEILVRSLRRLCILCRISLLEDAQKKPKIP